MREILFRAKQKNWRDLPKKEWWVEGYFFDDGFQNPEHYFVGGIEVVPYSGTADDEWDITGTYFCEIDPETLCQFTGMVDNNGNRIWENDIVDGHTKRGAAFWRSVVLWNEYKARFDVRTMDCNFPMTLDEVVDDISVNGPDYVVIGNIFDNPELLEAAI